MIETPQYALSFDGVDDWVQIPSFPMPQNVTLEVWAKSQEAVWNTDGFLVSHRTAGGGAIIHPNGGGTRQWQGFIQADNGAFQSIGTHIPAAIDDVFHHYAITYDRTADVGKMFFDGVEVVSTSALLGANTRTGATGELGIGRDVSLARFGHAIEDDVRIWNVARTQAQIAENMDTELVGNEPGLVGYWRFNEGAGPTAKDKTANANHGTITGAAYSGDHPFTDLGGLHGDFSPLVVRPKRGNNDIVFLVDWDDDGAYWGPFEDLSEILRTLTFSRGVDPAFGGLVAGNLDVELDNRDNLFNRGSTASIIGQRLRPYVGFQVRVAAGDTEYIKMTGKLTGFVRHEWDAGSLPIVTLRGTDTLAFLESEVAIPALLDQTTQDLAERILDASGVDKDHRSVTLGTGDLVGVVVGEGRSARAWLNALVLFGYTQHVDQDGKYVLRGRGTETPRAVGTIVAVNHLQDETDDEGLTTRVRAVVHPWEQDTADTTIYVNGRTPFELLAGDTEIIRAEFRDPTTRQLIGVGQVVTPVATTDYTAEDLGSVDRTANLSVTVMGDPGTSIELHVKNNHTATLRVTKSQLRGKKFIAEDTEWVERKIGQVGYPDLFREINSDLIQTKAIAEAVVAHFSSKFGTPRRRTTAEWSDVETWDPTGLLADVDDWVKVQLEGGRTDPYLGLVRGMHLSFEGRLINYGLILDSQGPATVLTTDIPLVEVWDHIA